MTGPRHPVTFPEGFEAFARAKAPFLLDPLDADADTERLTRTVAIMAWQAATEATLGTHHASQIRAAKVGTNCPQHTPGPWLVSPIRAQVDVPMIDAPICQLLWPTDLRSEDETKANARLIAAAPDLLAALQALLDREIHYGPGSVLLSAIRRAEAAVAKATGAGA